MPKYRVHVEEVWKRFVIIEAPTPNHARHQVRRGGGVPVEDVFEYTREVPCENWTVEREE